MRIREMLWGIRNLSGLGLLLLHFIIWMGDRGRGRELKLRNKYAREIYRNLLLWLNMELVLCLQRKIEKTIFKNNKIPLN